MKNRFKSNISIIILNVSGLTISIKRDGKRGLKNMTQVYAVYKKLNLKYNNIVRVKIKGQKKIHCANTNQ